MMLDIYSGIRELWETAMDDEEVDNSEHSYHRLELSPQAWYDLRAKLPMHQFDAEFQYFPAASNYKWRGNFDVVVVQRARPEFAVPDNTAPNTQIDFEVNNPIFYALDCRTLIGRRKYFDMEKPPEGWT